MPLLSICIPTYKRPEIVKKTIESIFSQGVENSLFDVCITDNSPTDETKNMIENELPKYKNLKSNIENLDIEYAEQMTYNKLFKNK